MAEEQQQFEQQILLQQTEVLLEGSDTPGLEKLLNEQRSSDIAALVELFDNEQRRLVFDVLDKPISAEVLEKVDEATRGELFEILDDQELTVSRYEISGDLGAMMLYARGVELLGLFAGDEEESMFVYRADYFENGFEIVDKVPSR